MMMKEFKLPSWWEILTPREDIRADKMKKQPFIVDLGDVKGDTTSTSFSDPRRFFERTFLTESLILILDTILSRLHGEGGSPILLLQARFGGGKTHALLTIYHVLTSPEMAMEHLKKVDGARNASLLLTRLINANQRVNIVTFTGTHVDPLHDKTPWGEIANQLGKYPVIQSHDHQKVSPGKKILKEILEDKQPLIILMDEMMEYVAKVLTGRQKDKISPTQILVFMQELSEVIAGLPRAVLVITMPTTND